MICWEFSEESVEDDKVETVESVSLTSLSTNTVSVSALIGLFGLPNASSALTVSVVHSSEQAGIDFEEGSLSFSFVGSGTFRNA